MCSFAVVYSRTFESEYLSNLRSGLFKKTCGLLQFKTITRDGLNTVQFTYGTQYRYNIYQLDKWTIFYKKI